MNAMNEWIVALIKLYFSSLWNFHTSIQCIMIISIYHLLPPNFIRNPCDSFLLRSCLPYLFIYVCICKLSESNLFFSSVLRHGVIPCCMENLPGTTLLEKSEFPSPVSLWLSRASQLRGEPWDPYPNPCWRLLLTWPCEDLAQGCTVHCEFICVTACNVYWTAFHSSLPHSLTLTFFLPLFYNIAWVW